MPLRFSPARGSSSLVLNSLVRGPVGAAATIAAGTTTTGNAGSSATVTNAGTSAIAVFDFTIPRGADGGLRYAFATSTSMADPGAGIVRFDNATPASITNIAISATDADGNTVRPYILTWDDSTNTAKGTVIFKKEGTGTALVFAISGTVTDNTTWVQIPVTLSSGTTLFSASDHIYARAERAGDAGAVSGPGVSVDGEAALWSGTAGTALKRATGTGAALLTSGVLTAGIVPTSNGGTGISNGTSGGILYYASNQGLASTAALTTNGMVIGGGAATAPSATAAATSGQIFIGVSSAAPAPQTVSGDITITSNGVTAIGAGKVTYAMVSSGALATAANIWAKSASTIAITSGLWDAGAIVTLTDATNVAVDLSTGINFEVILAGNRTLSNPTNPKVGQTGIIYINQDATGTRTLAYGTNWKFAASGVAPTLTTTTSAVDMLVYHVKTATFISASLGSKFA